tara:strand:- start:781 stop:1065 length:285 start_codon:yes stop_codon:yes gene_type:complete
VFFYSKKIVEKIMKLPYIPLATNNLEAVRKDPKGARCVYCLGRPNCDIFLELTDKTTIICPDCGVDAVVPASKVPDEETLCHWHNLGFAPIFAS